jgi:hypothetical protein
MHMYIAIAILVGWAFLGIVMFRKGTAALFGTPRSRVSQWILWAIVSSLLVVSLGVLTVRGCWVDVLPWCFLLLVTYYCVRGAFLLFQPSDRTACNTKGIGGME